MKSYPLTHIDPKAQIGENVEIGPFTTIYGDVQIGDGTWIGPNVTIMDGARIGKGCRIFPGAVISAIPQDLKFRGENSTAEIGDRTTIRECATINRGTAARGRTTVGRDVLVMAYAHVAHDADIGDHCILVNSVAVAGEAVIGEWAIIGGLTGVHQFCHVGPHAMVAAGSVIRKDVPPFVMAGRDPLAFHGINSVGLRRRGFETPAVNEIQDIYRLLYQSKVNVSKALERIEQEFAPSPHRDLILNFVRTSGRGIIKGSDRAED